MSTASILAAFYYRSVQNEKAFKKQQTPILSKYWSHNYPEARTKFLKSCDNIPSAKVHSIAYDMIQDDIAIDLCYIPSNTKSSKKPHLLIHICGTHGVEGYAGSAIQCKLLENISNNTKQKRPYHILFVHALNAYGMYHGRRFNRYNVDLNRNAILGKHQWKKLKSRDPNLTGYDSIKYLNPSYKPRYPWTDLYTLLRMVFTILTVGRAAAARAFVPGQYHKAQGIFYGGFQLQTETKSLCNFIVNQCKTEWDVDLMGLVKDKGSKLTVIDVHTGIGPKGVDLLLCKDGKYLKKITDLDGFPKEYFNNPKRLQAHGKSGDGKVTELSKVYELSVGGVRDGLVKMFKNVDRFIDVEYDSDKDGDVEMDERLDCVSITEEFGTVSPVKVIHALIMENAIYNLHLMDEDSLKVLRFRQKRLRNVFYLEDDIRWKYDVLRRGVALFNCLSNR